MNLADLLKDNLDRFGEYPLLHFKGKAITNAEIEQAAGRAAWGLTELGVKRGDRVTLVMNNSPEIIVAMLACFKIGAWAMPVVLSLRPPELTLILDDAEPSTLISHRLFVNNINEPVKEKIGVRHKIMVGRGEPVEGWIGWEDWIIGQSDVYPSCECGPDEIALLLYTSGTTGAPKGVMLSHQNLLENSLNSARSQELHEGEVNLLALPMNHSFGITAWLAALALGMKVVMLPRFDSHEVFRSIAKYQVESTAMVPTMLAFMLEVPEKERQNLTSLKRIVCGGAPLTLKLRHRLQEAFPHVQILEAYGLTEAGPAVTVTRPDKGIRDRSVGQVIDNQEICIMNEDGECASPGQVGEVCTKGANIMKGYYKQEEETEAVIIEGWLHTGDLGYLDEDGYLYLTGRIKDMIIRGGQNVYPVDIERVLRSHPDVAEAAVIGIPDEIYGEEIVAIVVKRRGIELSEQSILDHCRENLAPFQIPKQIIFTRILPRSSMGKVKKKDLKSQFGGVIGSGDEP